MIKVSVLISAYNSEDYIYDSVNSLLSQTFKNFEILIMDDGSTDNTLKVLNKILDKRIQIFSQKNRGKGAALNTLLKKARGEYLVIQDSDDISDKNRLKKLSQQLDSQPNIAGILSGYYLLIDKKLVAPRRIQLNPDQCRLEVHQQKAPSLDPTLMVRKDIALKIKFNEKLILCQGLDFILKLGEQHPITVIPEPLYYYRLHTKSTTKGKYKERVKYLFEVTNAARKRLNQKQISKEEFYKTNQHYSDDKYNNISAHFLDSTFWSIVFSLRLEAIKTALLSIKW